jgi:ribosomal protein S18 acetylase RimI-like enzyme
MIDFTPLDNPVWFALITGHQSMARSNGLARRYPSDVSPLAALAEPTPKAFADLSALVGPEESVGLFTTEPLEVPDDWQVVRTRWIDQMTCAGVTGSPSTPLLPLGPGDVPEMLALTATTQPGPFLPRTIDMGRYFGIRSPDGRLAAMAGERLKLNAFTEVSAVCTHPEFRGAGYGRALVASLAAQILAEKKVPFLHVKSENAAKLLYQKVGFSVRRAICVTVIAYR